MGNLFDWRNGWDYLEDLEWLLEARGFYFPYFPYWIDHHIGHC